MTTYTKNPAVPVLAIADNTTITVIELHTGEILSRHTIDPAKTYWRNNDKTRADGPIPNRDLCRDSGET